MPGTVCISGDALRVFAPTAARELLGPGSTYRAAAQLAAFYLEAGAVRVIFEYVFETPTQIEYFSAGLDFAIPRQVVTLWASPETLEARDALRGSGTRQGPRVAESFSTMSAQVRRFGCVVDTEACAATEVAARIHRFMRETYEREA